VSRSGDQAAHAAKSYSSVSTAKPVHKSGLSRLGYNDFTPIRL